MQKSNMMVHQQSFRDNPLPLAKSLQPRNSRSASEKKNINTLKTKRGKDDRKLYRAIYRNEMAQ
jgi:hypothetical protein